MADSIARRTAQSPKLWYRWPLTHAAFVAAVNVKIAGENLLRWLDVMPKRGAWGPPAGFEYWPPREDSLWNTDGCWEIRGRGIKHRQSLLALGTQKAWAMHVDLYHFARRDVVAAIEHARGAVDRAATELDGQGQAPDCRPTLILRATLRELMTAVQHLGEQPWQLPRDPHPADDFAEKLREFEAHWSTLLFRDMAYQMLTPAAPEPALNETGNAPRPAEVQMLFDALVQVECASALLAGCYGDAVELYERCGRPNEGDWPQVAAVRAERNARALEAARAAEKARGGNGDAIFVVDHKWVKILEELVEAYKAWNIALEAAIAAVPATGTVMNGGEARRAEQWTTKTLADLRELHGLIHPTRYGDDGLGLIRSGCVPLPPSFAELVRAISKKRLTLTDVREEPQALPPAPKVSAWEVAQAAALEAMRPFEEQLDQMMKENPKGWPRDSDLSRRWNELTGKKQAAQYAAFETHGWKRVDDRVNTPEKLGAAIASKKRIAETCRLIDGGDQDLQAQQVLDWACGVAAKEGWTSFPLEPGGSVHERLTRAEFWCKRQSQAARPSNGHSDGAVLPSGDQHHVQSGRSTGSSVDAPASNSHVSSGGVPPARPDAIPDPISNAALAKLTGYEDANYMSKLIRDALKKSKLAVKDSKPGSPVFWPHTQIRRAAPYLPEKFRAALKNSGLLKPE